MKFASIPGEPMLSRVRDFFRTAISPLPIGAGDDQHAIELATAALLVEYQRASTTKTTPAEYAAASSTPSARNLNLTEPGRPAS
ncbi:MAG: hypothetical protein M5R42_16520 [Rhodocyclaceae bacterium]|nr:hypothetical protein [Rhodocyclaceae bacterium]